jgi:hypothetical protein
MSGVPKTKGKENLEYISSVIKEIKLLFMGVQVSDFTTAAYWT